MFKFGLVAIKLPQWTRWTSLSVSGGRRIKSRAVLIRFFFFFVLYVVFYGVNVQKSLAKAKLFTFVLLFRQNYDAVPTHSLANMRVDDVVKVVAELWK